METKHINSSIAQRETMKTASWIGKMYVSLVVLETIGLIIGGFLALHFATGQPNSLVYIAIITLCTVVGFLYFACNSVAGEHAFQFWISVFLHVLIITLIIWNHASFTLGPTFEKVSLYAVIIMSGFQFIYLLTAPFVRRSFGWRIYKQIGEGFQLQDVYRTSQIFLSLLKLDVLIALLVVIMIFCPYVDGHDPAQLGINIAAFILLLVGTGCAFMGLRHENIGAMVVFSLCTALVSMYSIYAITTFAMNGLDNSNFNRLSFHQLIFLSAISIPIRIITLAWAYWCRCNFGLGFRNKVFLRQKASLEDSLNSGADDNDSAQISLIEYASPVIKCGIL